MPIYGCLTPDGYKNTQAAWLNPSAMTQRLNFATAIASGRLPLNQEPANNMSMTDGSNRPPPAQSNSVKPLAVAELVQTLEPIISADTQNAIDSSPVPIRAALVLGSPEFMRR
jgi:hypothetical protein